MTTKVRIIILALISFLSANTKAYCQRDIRTDISLDKGWRSVEDDHNKAAFDGFEKFSYNDKQWLNVDVPHNWDDYGGYRRMRHGNRHGYAWYRKSFTFKPQKTGQSYFLFFEGVGSYATVWLNGKKAGFHAGGRTTFTIEVTNLINLDGKPNVLAVRADHPANIKDLPWVCGGCSDERGFSEGSQPMGIFRPVHLVITNTVRVEPFGVHIWNDTTVSVASAQIHLSTEIKNHGASAKNITLVTRVLDRKGNEVLETSTRQKLLPGALAVIRQEPPVIKNGRLWSLEDPYLYNVISEVVVNGKVVDRFTTPYGVRWIRWATGKPGSSNQFFLNGKSVFINGIAEYEHLIGKSHAFSAEEIHSRVMQMKAAGFNAFRDAHSPHNLRYNNYWDSLGTLWWSQDGAHIWYDTPEFKANFKKLLTEWVKERRNSPSLILWGLQNESKIPTDFARECTQLIRELDPTSPSQRLVTTCNGGTGTDWDVPQNWTGTYGGDPKTYSEDVKRQVLIGEYGAWRTLDLHTEGPFVQNGVYSEDHMTQLMEMKVRLAESVRDKAAGQFMWLFNSHDNPGRVQGGEGYRELDKIGPVNYKGLLTSWEEPLDVFYMYRSNYARKDKEPMVYIVSHTWPDRWIKPGIKDSITVYSNCDEVELFNDVGTKSLGRRTRQGIGTHFQWDKVDIRYNVLYAVGYVNGKRVATDYIVLNHLPPSPGFNVFLEDAKPITASGNNLNYLYRVNCGGPDYVDKSGNTWMSDRNKRAENSWGSVSWTKDFPGMPAYFASQRKTNDPIKGTADWPLFQSFRYGREKLSYEFPVKDGEYEIELYFTEPWLGTGGGMDCTGWRLFDVAVNGKTVLKDLDIWKEVGHDAALKKVVKAKVSGGKLVISFPHVASGQAVISAIAIATADKAVKPAPPALPLITNLEVSDLQTSNQWSTHEWLNSGDTPYTNSKVCFSSLPSNLFGTEYIRTPKAVSSSGSASLATFDVTEDAVVYIGVIAGVKQRPGWLKDYEDIHTVIQNDEGQVFSVLRKRFKKGSTISLGTNVSSDAPMYTIAVAASTNIEPAYDLKNVVSYKAIDANIKGPAIIKGKVDGKDRVIFEKPSAANLLEWNIAVGVADIYSLTISYNNPQPQTIKGKLQLLMADGTLMREEDVDFTPTKPGKSNYISSSSGTMINAGNYKVRLTSAGAEGVSINALDVQ